MKNEREISEEFISRCASSLAYFIFFGSYLIENVFLYKNLLLDCILEKDFSVNIIVRIAILCTLALTLSNILYNCFMNIGADVSADLLFWSAEPCMIMVAVALLYMGYIVTFLCIVIVSYLLLNVFEGHIRKVVKKIQKETHEGNLKKV